MTKRVRHPLNYKRPRRYLSNWLRDEQFHCPWGCMSDKRNVSVLRVVKWRLKPRRGVKAFTPTVRLECKKCGLRFSVRFLEVVRARIRMLEAKRRFLPPPDSPDDWIRQRWHEQVDREMANARSVYIGAFMQAGMDRDQQLEIVNAVNEGRLDEWFDQDPQLRIGEALLEEDD